MTVTDLADAYVAELAEWEPAAAALIGRDASGLPDLSPDAVRARADLDRRTVAALSVTRPVDEAERRLAAVMAERLSADVSLVDVGFSQSLVAPLATPVHGVRTRIESASRSTEDDWIHLIELLEAVPTALTQHRATLEWARADGHVASMRQLRLEAAQIRSWVGTGPAAVVTAVADDPSVPPALAGRLGDAVAGAAGAFEETAQFLTEELSRDADSGDGCGPEVYAVTATAFLGLEVDPQEVADWGRREVAALIDRAESIAREIERDGDLDTVCARLDATEVVTPDDVAGWLEGRVAAAVDGMEAWGWKLPAGARDLRLVVTGAASGVMYYTPAPPDGSSPATVWWTVVGDVVPAWRQVTTIHHEGVPGHHLQHAVAAGSHLHPWQRHLCHVHGYAEGWAHHAEEMADEAGLLGGPAERLGTVLGALHRACRIVADTSLHLGGKDAWSHAEAVRYLVATARLDPVTARFEVDRFLAWPGQALAFRVGARAWLRLRAHAERKSTSEGTSFRPVDWYRRLLEAGPMGLCVLDDIAGEGL